MFIEGRLILYTMAYKGVDHNSLFKIQHWRHYYKFFCHLKGYLFIFKNALLMNVIYLLQPILNLSVEWFKVLVGRGRMYDALSFSTSFFHAYRALLYYFIHNIRDFYARDA